MKCKKAGRRVLRPVEAYILRLEALGPCPKCGDPWTVAIGRVAECEECGYRWRLVKVLVRCRPEKNQSPA